ncbi:hypothetical protein KBI52_17165 [Microvirga sp. HBU67558]|uniref:hypothetical protein n=1 Tax=Microvirga TaxID=186650 RepID=UPI001B38A495|nr:MULTISPECIES: hypothetical protein [unclassified Microvirga]MBQ0821924.1 hypothetical protein [Microvirga sp. HBU67558]
MANIGPDQVEAEARALLKEAIERSGWYPILSGAERDKRIEQDVERYWHLMAQEAARRLLDRFEACSRVAYHTVGSAQGIGSGAGRGS